MPPKMDMKVALRDTVKGTGEKKMKLDIAIKFTVTDDSKDLVLYNGKLVRYQGRPFVSSTNPADVRTQATMAQARLSGWDESQLKALERIFKSFDKNGNGAVDIVEFVEGVERLGLSSDLGSIASYLSVGAALDMDYDGSGTVTFDELLRGLTKQMQTRNSNDDTETAEQRRDREKTRLFAMQSSSKDVDEALEINWRANSLYCNGNYEQAMELYNQAISLFPGNFTFFRNRQKCIAHIPHLNKYIRRIDIVELRRVLRAFREVMTANECKSLFRRLPFVDKNSSLLIRSFERSDGSVDQRELGAGLSLLCKGTMAERMAFVFDTFDINHDGHMNKAEFIRFFETYTNGTARVVYALMYLAQQQQRVADGDISESELVINDDDASEKNDPPERAIGTAKSKGSVKMVKSNPSLPRSVGTMASKDDDDESIVDDEAMNIINNMSLDMYSRKVQADNRRDKMKRGERMNTIRHSVLNERLKTAASRIDEQKRRLLTPYEMLGLREPMEGLFMEEFKPLSREEAMHDQMMETLRQESSFIQDQGTTAVGNVNSTVKGTENGFIRKSSVFSVRSETSGIRRPSRMDSVPLHKKRMSTSQSMKGLREENRILNNTTQDRLAMVRAISVAPNVTPEERERRHRERRKLFTARANEYTKRLAREKDEGRPNTVSDVLDGRLTRLDRDLEGASVETVGHMLDNMHVMAMEKELEMGRRFKAASRHSFASLVAINKKLGRRASQRSSLSGPQLEDDDELMMKMMDDEFETRLDDIERLAKVLELTEEEINNLKVVRGVPLNWVRPSEREKRIMSAADTHGPRPRTSLGDAFPRPITHDGSIAEATEKVDLGRNLLNRNEYDLDMHQPKPDDLKALQNANDKENAHPNKPRKHTVMSLNDVGPQAAQERCKSASPAGSPQGSPRRPGTVNELSENSSESGASTFRSHNSDDVVPVQNPENSLGEALQSAAIEEVMQGAGMEAGMYTDDDFSAGMKEFITKKTRILKKQGKSVVDRMFKRADANKDLKLSFGEFNKWMGADNVVLAWHETLEKDFLVDHEAEKLSVEYLVTKRLMPNRAAKTRQSTKASDSTVAGGGAPHTRRPTMQFFITETDSPARDLGALPQQPPGGIENIFEASEGDHPEAANDPNLIGSDASISSISEGGLPSMSQIIARPPSSLGIRKLRDDILRFSRPEEDKTKRKRFVQHVKYDAFEEEPFDLDAGIILANVNSSLRSSGAPIPDVIHKAFGMPEMEKVFSATFWYIFCRLYQKHSKGEQGILLRNITASFVPLKELVEGENGPMFREYIGYSIGVAVIQQFFSVFHGCRDLFTERWRDEVCDMVLKIFMVNTYNPDKRRALFPKVRVPRRPSEPELVKKKVKTTKRIVYQGNVFEGKVSKDGQKHGYGKCSFLNGERYEGEWANDVREGVGRVTFADKSVYNGEWRNDKRNGRGVLRFTNGDLFDGMWVDNELHKGKGKFSYTNGEVYEGTFFKGKRSGHGTCHYVNRDKYVGEWMGDMRSGEGKMTYGNGDVFTGTWEDDKWLQGRGKVKYDNGEMYNGEFVEYRREGEGKVTLPNGDTFIGTWLNDKWHTGDCTYTYFNGGRYSGQVCGNKGKKRNNIPVRSGHGLMEWSDGSKYDGEWKSDRMHGAGTYRDKNGLTYTGNFANGMREGGGTQQYSEREKYIGMWRRDQRSGVGTMYYMNAKDELEKWEGMWVEDKPIESAILSGKQ